MPPIDHRLAFVLLCALLLGAAIPIAFAWARVIPEDDPPFQIDASSKPATARDARDNPQRILRPDPYAVVFLVYITLSYVSQFPGLPRGVVISRLFVHFPEVWTRWTLFVVAEILVVLPAVAVCYSIFRRGPLRLPLIAAGFLVLLLWLLAPWLQSAFIAS